MSANQPEGYLATPTSGKGNPVLVLHAWWGLNNTIKRFCDRLAGEGFVAFAPDIYQGKVTNQISEAEKLVTVLDEDAERAKADIANAVTFLEQYAQSDDTRVAVIGFSMGAYYAIDVSVTAPESVHAVVIFYGTGPADFSQSKAEYLGHFAGEDEYEPQEYVEGLEQAIRSAGRPVTFHIYKDTGHWFFEPDRVDAYDAEAANLAWDRTVAFLKRSFTG